MTQQNLNKIANYQVTGIEFAREGTDRNGRAWQKFNVSGWDMDSGEEQKFQIFGNLREKLTEGSVYEIMHDDPKPNRDGDGFYDADIKKITPVGSQQIAQPSTRPTTPPPPTPQPASTQTPSASSKPTKVDLSNRFFQYNTHARTAHMQATERVRLKVQLLLEGKLFDESSQPFEAVSESTLNQWYVSEVDNYWSQVINQLSIDTASHFFAWEEPDA